MVVDREGYPVVVVCELSEIVEVARIVAGVEVGDEYNERLRQWADEVRTQGKDEEGA